MNKKVISIGSWVLFIFLIITILIGVVRGQEDPEIQSFPRNSVASITETCRNNGTSCSSSAQCNITIRDPYGSIIISSQYMTQNPLSLSWFNYTLQRNQTSTVGAYLKSTLCQDGGLKNFNDEPFLITQGGYNLSIAQTLMYGFIMTLLISLFIFSIYGYRRLQGGSYVNEKKVNYGKYGKMALMICSYLLFTVIIFVSWQISEILVAIDVLSFIFKTLFVILGVSFPIVFMFSLYLFVWNFVQDRKIQRLITRGLYPR